MKDIKLICDEAVEWLQKQVKDAGAKGIVLGLSGGIDSAVVAALAKRAFPDDLLCVNLPCYSNPADEADAWLVVKALNLGNVKTVVLDEAFDSMKRLLGASENDPKLSLANIKSRLRMVSLYYYASINNYLVAGTGNRSELTIGYFTKHGDGGSDLLPLAGFVKHEVRALARYLGVPEEVIVKPPTAGLWENQTDESEMGMSYDELDEYILTGQASDAVKAKVDTMFARSEHKRRTAPKFIPTEKQENN